MRYFFYCGQWLSSEAGLEKLLNASLTDPRDALTVYSVTTYTSNIKGAGTDANVFINMFGSQGQSGPRELDNPKNNFEQVGREGLLRFLLPSLFSLGHWGPCVSAE